MIQSLALLVAKSAETAEPAKRHLPIPPWGFGVIAFGVFVVLLVITFSFRSSGTKH